ncbi:inorganic phosphate transporter [bacterium]|nr:inorganic phosphate transporter [bacterium]
MELVLFLSSGLFMGWSLGANDAANVFGTAVGTRMVRFRTAALVCSAFIILGAVVSGAGAAHTLGRLGAVNALPGAFTVALAAGLTTLWMTRLNLPVSTSQAVVGAIIGWNFFADTVTDTSSLGSIVSTWVACPLLAAAVAAGTYVALRRAILRHRPHLLELDAFTRLGLLAVGAFGSYSLGANNIANVVGVFVPDNPFRDVHVVGLTITGAQQLFALGGLAIAVGVYTYSERVMKTVGGGLLHLSPLAAFVVVLAQSITLFLFASEGLEHFLASRGLPTFPLVPVSSSQAVVGAIIGIGLLKGGKGIRYGVLGEISLGWLTTPLVAGVTAFVLLFVVENVFDRHVYRAVSYRIDGAVIEKLAAEGIVDPGLHQLRERTRVNSERLQRDLKRGTKLDSRGIFAVIDRAQLGSWRVDPGIAARGLDRDWFTPRQIAAVRELSGRTYERRWRLRDDLAAASPEWRPLPATKLNRIRNKELAQKLEYLEQVFLVRPHEAEADEDGVSDGAEAALRPESGAAADSATAGAARGAAHDTAGAGGPAR